MAHNHLKQWDYFPQRGDLVVYSGYRNLIVEVEIPLESYWGQTNVWMGLVCHTEIAIEGDSKPLVDPSNVAGGEVSPASGAMAATGNKIKSAE